jgi:hypothetical protein
VSTEGDCPCLDRGPKPPAYIEERNLGVDDTEGRFADVTLVRCALCRRLWLRHFYEIEGFSRSGRWAEALIDDVTAATITPRGALKFIETRPFRVVGGSYYDGNIHRIASETKP